MNTAEVIVKSLENEGVQYVFGVPGEENLDILEALRKSESIEFVVSRHEQAAGFMAATVGRLSGIPGVALSTLGPGATNLVTAAAYAQLGAMPLVMLTGQKPIKHSKQGAFQIIDVVDMMQPITKYSKSLVDGKLAAASIREAFRLASLERPGAALLEVPEDIAAEDVEFKPMPISHARRPIAEHKAIAQAIELLLESRRPLLMVGAGSNRKRTNRMLTQLVQQTNIPFANTMMGKGVLDETMPQFAGTAALTSNDYVHHTIEQADLIINIGHDVVEKPPFIMRDGQQVIHINFESAAVNPIYYPQVEVVGDIANAIWQIKEELKNIELPNWDTDYHRPAREKLDNWFAGMLDSHSVTPPVLVNELRLFMPDDGIVALDNGMYKIWFARHYVTKLENTLLLDNALATMGAGLPSAMAAKLVYPEKKVVAVAGDGGFMMNSQEIETAIRLNLDLIVIILNDQKYRMISWKQQQMNKTDFGLDFGNPDFVKYAESYGARGIRAENTDQLRQALNDCNGSQGVCIIDLVFDYSSNAEGLKI